DLIPCQGAHLEPRGHRVLPEGDDGVWRVLACPHREKYAAAAGARQLVNKRCGRIVQEMGIVHSDHNPATPGTRQKCVDDPAHEVKTAACGGGTFREQVCEGTERDATTSSSGD